MKPHDKRALQPPLASLLTREHGIRWMGPFYLVIALVWAFVSFVRYRRLWNESAS